MAEHSMIPLPTGPAPKAGPTLLEALETPLDPLFAEFLRSVGAGAEGAEPTLRQWVELAEAWRIAHALRASRGNRSAAARRLGIGRRTLYTKMRKLGIEPTFEPPAGGRR